MGYTYTPTYYSSLHDSITSLCKNILPFSLKKRRLIAAESRLSKLQSDNLKWQQDSFHQILNLMGLSKEGIIADSEVSAFRTHLLDTLIASPPQLEHPPILRDKLLFLQELLYAKCISEEEYHSSKRPLLQRLAVQGAEIETRNVVMSGQKDLQRNESEDEWSVIDLKDDIAKETPNPPAKNRSKSNSAMKQIKGAASAFGFGSSHKHRDEKSVFETQAEYSDTKSILMQEGSGNETEKAKAKPLKSLKQWGFKKWKKNESEDETAPLPLNAERSDCEPYREGPDTKSIKRKLHSDGSPSDFFIDKVLGDKIKKELSRIQTELSSTNPNLKFSDDQMDAISTKLPVDKGDLKQFFPKAWCERYGEVVLDVVKKEFKDHVEETREKYTNTSKRWTTFDNDDDENCHPNLFSPRESNLNPFWSPAT